MKFVKEFNDLGLYRKHIDEFFLERYKTHFSKYFTSSAEETISVTLGIVYVAMVYLIAGEGKDKMANPFYVTITHADGTLPESNRRTRCRFWTDEPRHKKFKISSKQFGDITNLCNYIAKHVNTNPLNTEVLMYTFLCITNAIEDWFEETKKPTFEFFDILSVSQNIKYKDKEIGLKKGSISKPLREFLEEIYEDFNKEE